MKKKPIYFNLETYDYTPYARELTEEEMYLVNGGRVVKGSARETEVVPSRPSSSSESGNSSGTSATSNSSPAPAATQTTTSSSQTNSSSQQNNTESQPQTSSAPTCTAAQMAAAQGAAMNAYFAEQDKKREENNKQNNNSGSSSSSSSSSSALSHQEQYEMAKKDYDEHYGNVASETSSSSEFSNSMDYSQYRDENNGKYSSETSNDNYSNESNNSNGSSVSPVNSDLIESGSNTDANNALKLSDDAKKFLKVIEGFSGDIYDANNRKHVYVKGDTLQTGDWTIGYGHKLTAAELDSGIFAGGIDEPTASIIFENDSKEKEDSVKRNLSDYKLLNQNQFDAAVSAAYSLGPTGFYNSEIRRVIDEYGESITDINIISTDEFMRDISDAFRYHCPPASSPISRGIKERRFNEVQMFLYGDYVRDDTPSYLFPWKEGTIINK